MTATILFLVLVFLTSSSCARRTYPEQATNGVEPLATETTTKATAKDTTTETRATIRTDSVKETVQLTQAEVQLPQVDIERQTVLETRNGTPEVGAFLRFIKDTASTITDGRYTSTATIKGGKLTHTLQTLPGAKVQAQVPTTTKEQKVTESTSQATKDYHKETENRNTETTIPMPVEKKLTVWQKFKQKAGGWALAALAIAIVLTIAKWLARRQKNR